MTVPDVFGRHFGSRPLELITCVTMLIALVPWGQYQFIGLQVVLSNLGLRLTPVQCVLLAGIIAFLWIAASGIRSPAFVSILKDSFMLLGVVLVGLAAVLAAGGTSEVSGPEVLTHAQTTMAGQALVFAMTTILFQSVVFYLGFGGAYVFPARSERAVKSSTVWMPMYMLIYPFLVFASYYGLKHHPDLDDPNTVFMVTAKGLLPEWMLGLVAAGAALSGVLVLAATALSIGGMVSRNLAPNVAPAAQRRWTVVVVAGFLVLARGAHADGIDVDAHRPEPGLQPVGSGGARLAGDAVRPSGAYLRRGRRDGRRGAHRDHAVCVRREERRRRQRRPGVDGAEHGDRVRLEPALAGTRPGRRWRRKATLPRRRRRVRPGWTPSRSRAAAAPPACPGSPCR